MAKRIFPFLFLPIISRKLFYTTRIIRQATTRVSLQIVVPVIQTQVTTDEICKQI